ncbi:MULTISPECIES: helix-turn-helix domain-containing protein [Acinetobacter]|uniref:DNA-binding protein n=1 Tax=Acinetobacter tandoii TaxID=202954 RepID=A0A5N4WNU0_9GAMM|nr:MULTISPECIES: helix-turn-helix domain-containing protein [Acinetobacter]KAB1858222.1 DNA-binding protein [Acinetobacter tandoii]
MNQSTQYNQILAHLKQSKTITQAEAIQLFNCYCLSSVISRLRKAGHDIVTHYEPNLVNKGTHARYEYKMRDEQ